MRINDTKYGFYSYQNQQNRSNINNTTKKTSTSAEVNISSRGREISQAMMSEQAQRQQRIQELKQQIADGNYHVDSSKIAEKMTAFWKNTSI
ncbi:flagellar biosynthesis anti-sigma factor FlgM [Bacillus sp. 1P10SD]|jgi:negative regulator of flagellin synthesis FlgM|uniref:flagellar biosynthesis anti-sigma factor FlgM n=1 Tax=unclassified Bacillus (in: firmicutes) TaxID=185979 RepID=UPI00285E0776|nr:flagellar biosynthesis anti-sigma factor FlgM [Bacillus sp. SLBN-46]MDR6123765.1 negative regulator of flagellin synthesis FlgM [Bacillus sp. SLBN-46]